MTGYRFHPEELQEAARYYAAMSATRLPDAAWPRRWRERQFSSARQIPGVTPGTNLAIADSSQARAVRRSRCEYVAGTSTASNLGFDAQVILRIADARSP
jgi:hypothetical protein